MTKIISVTIVDLVTPKAGAKQELLFNEPASVFYINFQLFLTFFNKTGIKVMPDSYEIHIFGQKW